MNILDILEERITSQEGTIHVLSDSLKHTLDERNKYLSDYFEQHDIASRLRSALIIAQRKLHTVELYASHGVGTMAECHHPECQNATREMLG